MSQINYSATVPSSSLIHPNQDFIFNQNSTEEWQAQIENGLETDRSALALINIDAEGHVVIDISK